MKTRFALIGLAASLACMGCSGVAAQEDKAKLFAQTYAGQLCSDPRKCTITVKVAENCSFTVTPFTLGVPAANHNVKLHWVIDPNSYGSPKFTANAIAFKSGGAEFDGHTKVTDTEFRVNDKNDGNSPKPRFNAYSITVTQGKATCTADPTIVNDF